MERQKLILGLQTVSAIGILVLGTLSYFGQSTRELRIEMKEGFAAIRTQMKEEHTAMREEMKEEHADIRAEMRSGFAAVRKEMKEEHADIRAEMRSVNSRLSRVEGYLGLMAQPEHPMP